MKFIIAKFNRIKSITWNEVPYRIYQFFTLAIVDSVKRKFKLYSNNDYGIISLKYKKIQNEISLNKISIYQFKDFNVLKNHNWKDDLYNEKSTSLITHSFVNKQNYNEFGDVKYVWEISRFYHIPYLATKAADSYDKDLENLIEEQILEWIDQNPFLETINWVSGIEVGIRSINWVIGLDILASKFSIDSDFYNQFSSSLSQHFDFLVTHLSKYSSGNNHLIAELVGILYLSTHLKGHRPSMWYEKSISMLESEIFKQFHEDGGGKEQSLHYHTFTLDLFLTAEHHLELHGRSFSHEALLRLKKATEFLNDFLDLEVVEFGDSDSSYVLSNPFEPEKNHYVEVQDLSNTLLNDSEKDKRSYHNLLFKKSTNTDLFNRNKSLLKYCKVYEQTGYVLYKDETIKLIFDFGPIGMGEIAAHGHSDILSFILYVKGHPVIIDPGTYQYHERYKKWRNYFRGISAHNTISVNHMNQAQIAGRMNWNEKGEGKLKEIIDDDTFFVAEASHNGFITQGLDVLHTRKLIYNKVNRTLKIHDVLTSNEKQSYSFHLHFHPDLKKLNLSQVEIKIDQIESSIITISSNHFKNAELICGQTNPPFGWYSESFDKKRPSNSLRYSVDSNNGFETVTEIKIEDDYT